MKKRDVFCLYCGYDVLVGCSEQNEEIRNSVIEGEYGNRKQSNY